MESPPAPTLKHVVEALLFSAQKALTPKELRDVFVQAAQDENAPEAAGYRKVRDAEILEALETLEREYAEAGRSYRLLCVAGAWQFASAPEFSPWLRVLLGRKARPPRLSQPALETLTIIAYRQPSTRAEIEQIRGVSVDGVMQTLLERGLVEAVGRAEVVGRPVTYGTTPAFLEYFGLRALEDLPAADELRRIPVTKPESLLTVEPGTASEPQGKPAEGDHAVTDAQPVTEAETHAEAPAEGNEGSAKANAEGNTESSGETHAEAGSDPDSPASAEEVSAEDASAEEPGPGEPETPGPAS